VRRRELPFQFGSLMARQSVETGAETDGCCMSLLAGRGDERVALDLMDPGTGAVLGLEGTVTAADPSGA
jgi:hypothetical protein